MNIIINVPDKIVIIDNVALQLPDIDWSAPCFVNDPGRENDDVEGVEFDTERGTGLVMYKTVQTRQSMRPAHKGPDCPLIAGGPPDCDFYKLFGWVVDAWRLRKAEMELEEAKKEAERVARAEMEQSFEPSQASPVQSANSEDVEALKAQLAAQKAENSAMQKSLDEIKGDLASLYAANKKIVEGGA